MKTSRSVISILLVAPLFGCQPENVTQKGLENLKMADFECLNKQANQLLTAIESNKMIYGEWKLYGMLTMLPTKAIPDIKIVLSNIPTSPSEKPVAEIFENSVPMGRVKFVLKEINRESITSVLIESENVSLPADYYNFIKGHVRICNDELMIDNGMAFDAPAYLFRKVK
jgi:hypothetical protein